MGTSGMPLVLVHRMQAHRIVVVLPKPDFQTAVLELVAVIDVLATNSVHAGLPAVAVDLPLVQILVGDVLLRVKVHAQEEDVLEEPTSCAR